MRVRRLLDGVHLAELFAAHEVEELLEARLDLHGLHDVVEVGAVEGHVPAEGDGQAVRQAGIERLVDLLHQRERVLDLLRLGLVLDEVDGVALVPDLGEGVDHRAVHHRLLEGLAQLGVGQDHALEGGLMVDPRELVFREEVARVVRTLAHQLANVFTAVVEVEVPGPAH